MHPSNSPLRYPGGKGKLTKFLQLVFEENDLLDGHYVEPYAGGAGVALNLLLLEYASCVHLNDIDKAVYAFWHSVINAPDELCKLIRDSNVSMKEWHVQKSVHQDTANHSLLQVGFSTFFLNRTNRSGILKGGVVGGKNQDGKWKLDARYNKSDLCRRIEKIALCRSRIRLYNLDAAALIKGVLPSLPQKTLVYLDPPYYVKADGLYENHYAHEDHVTISKLVKKEIQSPWIVSYDNTPEIAEMYKGRQSLIYDMNYSASSERSRGSEVMFFSKGLSIPDVGHPVKIMVD